MDLEINALIVYIGISFLYLDVCGPSLCYFVAKYKLSESEVLEFFQTLKYPLTLAFSEKPRIDVYAIERGKIGVAQFIAQLGLQKAILGRYVSGLIMIAFTSLIPIVGLIRSEGVFNKVMYGGIFLTHLYLSYGSWRFGHSLKPKSSE
jgi:hypothetical protein